MNTPQPHQHGPDEFWGDSVRLGILVACEDAGMAKLARAMIERVLPLLPFEAEAHTTMLEFAAFGLKQALEEIERPDIVIVAARGLHPLPAAVKGWLEKWAGGGHGLTCAMTAVFERQHQWAPAAVEAKAFLKDLAARTRVDWLEAGHTPPAEESGQYRQDLAAKASRVSSTLTEIIRKPHPPTWI